MLGRIVMAVLAMVLCAPAAQADQIVPQSAARELLSFTIPGDPNGPSALDGSERVRFAKAIAAACKDYRRIVPSITPDEKAWLDTEMGKESSAERMFAAADSEIYARYQAAQFLDTCLGLTNSILTVDSPVSWAFLARLFISDNISEYVGRAGIRSVTDTDITAVDALLGHYTTSAIIDRILVPALAR